jgi:hypothetical protein
MSMEITLAEKKNHVRRDRNEKSGSARRKFQCCVRWTIDSGLTSEKFLPSQTDSRVERRQSRSMPMHRTRRKTPKGELNENGTERDLVGKMKNFTVVLKFRDWQAQTSGRSAEPTADSELGVPGEKVNISSGSLLKGSTHMD